jgi:hypothetical protein
VVEVVDWTKQYGIKSALMSLAQTRILSFTATKQRSDHLNAYYMSGRYDILQVGTFKALTILSHLFGKYS